MTFREKLLKIIEFEGFKSVSAFERHVGLYNGAVTDMVNPTQKTLAKILKSFPNLNPNWLQYDDVDMYLDKKDQPTIVHGSHNVTTNGNGNTFKIVIQSQEREIEALKDQLKTKEELINILKERIEEYKNKSK